MTLNRARRQVALLRIPLAGLTRATRSITRKVRVAAALGLIAICSISPRPDATGPLIVGQRPSYGPSAITDVPNFAAVDRMVWMPGLDAGWDPQGLAIGRGSLFVSAYQSTGAWQFRGPCRVFRVDPQTGRETGHFDVAPPCGHAGGIAYAGEGKLVVVDTHTLFEFDLDRAFGGAGLLRTLRLGRGLKGAFAASGNGAIWIGDYQESRPAKIFKFDLAAIEALENGATLRADAASAVIPIPTYGQGGALDPSGTLWVSRSNLGWGFLDKLDGATGRLESRFPIAAGTEGLVFDQRGRLWAVSETGARHLPLRYPFFPLIFRLDPARLEPLD
jgi:streptogramin lyase